MSKIYLAEKSLLDGVGANFCTCSTAAATAAKTAELSGFTLKTGAQATVKFTYANTAASPTLNINNTGAKSIYYHNAAVPTAMLVAGGTYLFVFDGDRWQLMGNHFVPTSSVGAGMFFNDVVRNFGTSSSSPDNGMTMQSSDYTTTRSLGPIDFAKYLAMGYKQILFFHYTHSDSSHGSNFGVNLYFSKSNSTESSEVVQKTVLGLASSIKYSGCTIDISRLNGTFYFIAEIKSRYSSSGSIKFETHGWYLLA